MVAKALPLVSARIKLWEVIWQIFKLLVQGLNLSNPLCRRLTSKIFYYYGYDNWTASIFYDRLFKEILIPTTVSSLGSGRAFMLDYISYSLERKLKSKKLAISRSYIKCQVQDLFPSDCRAIRDFDLKATSEEKKENQSPKPDEKTGKELS